MPRAAPVMNTVRPLTWNSARPPPLTGAMIVGSAAAEALASAQPTVVGSPAMSALGPSSAALELAEGLRRRELTAVELFDACLAAVDERNPELNAVIWRNDEDARAAAADADRRLAAGEQAPFLGVPIPIKDLTPVAGWPVSFGSHGAPDAPSEESEIVVDKLVDAGFVLCGRTNPPAFGVITAAENLRFGPSPNP